MENNYRQFTKKEADWIKEFKKVMAKAPSSLFMFVGGSYGTVQIYAGRVMKNGRGRGVDGDNTCEYIETNMECDGGDW